MRKSKKILAAVISIAMVAQSFAASGIALAAGTDGISINDTFSDSTFRAYISSNFDSDNNGFLSDEEIAAVTAIDVSTEQPAIKSVAGVGVFTELKSLDCSSQAIKALDVSALTKLTYLDASSNQIPSLNLSSNTELTYLDVSENLMTELGLSQNSKLVTLNASGISITGIDVTGMSALRYLSVNNTAVSELDLSKNSNLEALYCAGTKALNFLDVSNHSNLVYLNCSLSALTTLNASGNAALLSVDCSGSAIATLVLSGDTALSELNCSGNKLAEIDLSANTNLTKLNISGNKLGKNGIHISNNTKLEDLNISDNGLESIDIGNNTSLKVLDCSINNLTAIDTSANTALTTLNVSSNKLTALDVSKNSNLNNLNCDSNSLTALDLSSNEGFLDEEGNMVGTVSCAENSIDINLDETNYNYDLSQLPNFIRGTGIEPQETDRRAMVALDKKAGLPKGATIDAYNLLPDLNATSVTYQYYYGLGKNYATFKLNINNPLKVKVMVEGSSNNAEVGKNIEIQRGSEVMLTAIHSVTGLELENVTWSSGNDKIATIDENTGRLSCVGVGETPIYVTFNGRTIGYVTLESMQPVEGIVLDKTEINLEQGTFVDASKKTATIIPTVLPDNAGHTEVTWTSSNPRVATVSQTGVVRAAGNGTTTITCTSEYGAEGTTITAECTVNVKQRVNSLSLSESSLNMFAGDIATLTGTVAPTTAVNQDLEWTSDNEAVATVDTNGNVTAVSQGTAHITCTSADSPEAKAVCTVTVVENVSGITLNHTSYDLILGSTEDVRTVTLEATLEGGDSEVTYNKTWTSSDANVAYVDKNGKVTARAPGEAVITCEVTSTRKASCKIKVTQRATGIRIVKDKTTMNVGETMTVTAALTPDTVTNKAVLWVSSDESIATVSQDGVIKAVGKGTTQITCTTKDGSEKTSTFTLTVKKLVESLEIDTTDIDLYVGKTQTIKATITPSDANAQSLIWTSSDTNVAIVSSSGVVRGCGEGTAVITCTTRDESNLSKSCNVTVHQQITSISLDNTYAILTTGETMKLTPTIAPENVENAGLVWTSSNDSIAKVSDTGVVTAMARGSVTITCAAEDGLGAKATCRITVNQLVTSIKLSNPSVTMLKGKTARVTATIAPSNANNKSVEWKSSNTKVATVSGGTINAISNGTAVITCTATDGSGIKATCKVTVINPVTSIKLNATKKTLNVGKTFTLKATVAPTNAGNKNVTWTSSDKKVATVSATGVVKAVGRGTATITCTAKDGSGVKTSCVVTTVQKVTRITLNKKKITIKRGKTFTLKATIKPTNANNKNVTWKSSNKRYATVSANGVVTGKKKGKVTITCRAKDGSRKYAKCTVIIK